MVERCAPSSESEKSAAKTDGSSRIPTAAELDVNTIPSQSPTKDGTIETNIHDLLIFETSYLNSFLLYNQLKTLKKITQLVRLSPIQHANFVLLFN